MCSVKGCCTAVSVVLLVYCNCCLGATNPGRPDPHIQYSGDAGGQMMAIFLRKYQRPRISERSARGERSGRGRPGFVAPKQQLQYTMYRVLSSTAVQQYNRDSSLAAFHTTRAKR